MAAAPASIPALALGAAAAFAAAAALTRLVRDGARRRELVDRPNDRSSHRVPVPRLGGAAILTAFLAGSIALGAWGALPRGAFAVIAAIACVAALGLADDLRPLPARVRILVQAALALAVVLASGAAVPGTPWLGALPLFVRGPLLVLWIVWLTNLYNFMDGIDGLAGGQAVFAGAGLALAAFSSGAGASGWLCVLLAASSLGFLVFNFPRASIFMGDAGSTAIGFSFACLPLLPEARPLPLEAVAVALSFFILDATTTLLRRMLRGERWFEAHRSHLYQRPVARGVPHRAVTLAAWGGMSLVAVLAARWPAAGGRERAAILAVPLLLFAVASQVVARIERRDRLPSGGGGRS